MEEELYTSLAYFVCKGFKGIWKWAWSSWLQLESGWFLLYWISRVTQEVFANLLFPFVEWLNFSVFVVGRYLMHEETNSWGDSDHGIL